MPATIVGRVICVAEDWRYTPNGSKRLVSSTPPGKSWKRLDDASGARLWDKEMNALLENCAHIYR